MVSSVTAGTPLTIQIFDPSNNPVSIVQINVSQDGKYTGTIKATGALWKLNGKYTVKVQYGPPNVTAQATFNFHTPVFTSNVFQLKDPNSQQTFNVNYTISGGSVKTMTIDAQSLSVIVSVNSTNDGSISLQLPRALIDAKTSSGQDDAFVVLIDGAQVIPQISISDLNYRTLTIQFLQGDKKIDIIGTQISGNNQVNTRTNVVTTVTVSADRQSYSYGDIITVSGMVSSVTAGTPLTIQIFDPSNNLVKAYQTDVSQNGMYADSIRITGALWKSIGTYTIKVQYGPPNITAQTTFNFISGSIGTSGPNEIDIAQGAGTSVQTACVATNSCFMPNTLYVSLGTTVTWKNTDTAMHTICSGKATDDQCGKVFEDDTLKPGQIFQYTFANAGTFEYLCSIHPWMIGQVVVGASSPSQLSVQKQYQSCPDCPTSSSTTRQAPPTTITVATDKQVYDHNSKIIITGHVSNPYTGQIVQVKITSTSGNMVSGKIVSLDNDGNYITILSTTGNLWFENGQYKLAVQYNDGQSVTNSTYFQLAGPAPEIAPVNTPVITPTQQDVDNINKARSNQTIAAEINVGNDKTDTKSIDSSVQVQTTSNTPDSLGVKVSAANQTGPKVIVFNINATTINVKNLKDLGVMYDGKPITPAQNMDSILHAKSTDEPSFAIIVTQSGVQVLVLIPHFSTHTITITNMTQVIPAVPEFGPVAGLVVVVSMILCVVASKRFYITC
jgi:plastocyanin